MQLKQVITITPSIEFKGDSSMNFSEYKIIIPVEDFDNIIAANQVLRGLTEHNLSKKYQSAAITIPGYFYPILLFIDHETKQVFVRKKQIKEVDI